jgi:hypothetical protein
MVQDVGQLIFASVMVHEKMFLPDNIKPEMVIDFAGTL